jgi:hypothetical protein
MTFTKDARALNEIAKLEQDLENLERRYAALEQAGRWAKASLFLFMAALVALVLGGYVVGNVALIGMSYLVLILSMAVATLRYIFGTRWIDVVSWSPGPHAFAIKRTEAMAVEDMIADRKARLAALREEQS